MQLDPSGSMLLENSTWARKSIFLQLNIKIIILHTYDFTINFYYLIRLGTILFYEYLYYFVCFTLL